MLIFLVQNKGKTLGKCISCCPRAWPLFQCLWDFCRYRPLEIKIRYLIHSVALQAVDSCDSWYHCFSKSRFCDSHFPETKLFGVTRWSYFPRFTLLWNVPAHIYAPQHEHVRRHIHKSRDSCPIHEVEVTGQRQGPVTLSPVSTGWSL